MKILLSLIVLTAATFSSKGQSLNGDTATLDWGTDVSMSSLPAVNSNFGFGAETIGLFAPTFPGYSAGGMDVNVSGNTVAITLPSGDYSSSYSAQIYDGLAFNGFVLNDLTRPLASATLAGSTGVDFTTSDFGIVGGELWVNLAGFTFYSPDQIDITVTTAPEPSTWALMLMGCAAVVFIRRTLRKAPRHCIISTS